MEETEFSHWLQGVQDRFASLSSAQKNTALDVLIATCPAAQLYHLSHHLEILLHRDFLAHLPREIVYYLLQYLPPQTLLCCCHVSHTWNDVITNCSEVWRAACLKVAVSQTALACTLQPAEYKHLYLTACLQHQRLRDDTALETKVLRGHEDRVMAMYYHQGRLATGSDDRSVRIWDVKTGMCIAIIMTHTVADLKMTDSLLITGSFDTTAATWDLHRKQRLQIFAGHVAAVFSVNFNLEMCILVTGSADSTVRVWGLHSGACLRTLTEHRSAWIVEVQLHYASPDDHYLLLSRDSTSIRLWKLSCDHTLELLDECHGASDGPLVPGFQVQRSVMSHAYLDESLNIRVSRRDLDQYIQNNSVRPYCTETLDNPCTVNFYLGGGEQLDAFLVTVGEQPRLQVYHRTSGELIASVPLERNYRQSRRGTTFTLGETSWLDGFHHSENSGLVFASSLIHDNSILLMQWRNAEHIPSCTQPGN